MARNQVMRMLGQPDKGASGTHRAGGVLSRLWRQMLKDLNVNIQRWNDCMYTFVNDPRNGYPPNKRDQQSARGNLTKEFARPEMTWKVYMKALRFLGAKNVTIAVEVNYHNGSRSTHSTKVNLDSPAVSHMDFMNEIRQEPSFRDQPEHLRKAAAELEEELDIPYYTELDDDAQVRGLIYELCNPYAEPFEYEGECHVDDTHSTTGASEHAQGFEPGTEPFAGSLMGKRAYEQYLADTQQQQVKRS